MSVTFRGPSGVVQTVDSPDHVAVIERLIARGDVERADADKPKRAPRKPVGDTE